MTACLFYHVQIITPLCACVQLLLDGALNAAMFDTGDGAEGPVDVGVLKRRIRLLASKYVSQRRTTLVRVVKPLFSLALSRCAVFQKLTKQLGVAKQGSIAAAKATRKLDELERQHSATTAVIQKLQVALRKEIASGAVLKVGSCCSLVHMMSIVIHLCRFRTCRKLSKHRKRSS